MLYICEPFFQYILCFHGTVSDCTVSAELTMEGGKVKKKMLETMLLFTWQSAELKMAHLYIFY